MKIYTHGAELKNALLENGGRGSIGFVPTMGALHQGHLALVQRALKENSLVVVSIFVNPTQFNNTKDLETYPRNLKEDVALLATLSQEIIVFAPNVEDIYPNKITSKSFRFGGLEVVMEGKHREGHFDGVGTVVNALFEIVQPTNAYFGEKDFQQLQIIKKMVRQQELDVNIIGCPIVREPHGLAMSSRNKRLSPEQRNESALIFQTLKEVRKKFDSHTIPQLNKLVAERFLNNAHFRLEYFEIANEATLRTAQRKLPGNTYRAFIAVFVGPVRLIDNMPLN
ncbi:MULTISPECIES: pantoate--beta-alanine ligase [Altibacter]|uniref:pantoate--beta-alanine ligase n=1 Tax=Altibacter TaxID=1535231 RepID=UPI000555082B|nr:MULTISPECIES: pantoate--beta-alanine ligase [Altibacter]MCW9036917.1 pantoate--beta-alanine ligase [Altibacter sp.]